MGHPFQNASVLVDINYPTTIIFNNDTFAYSSGEQYTINNAPWYLDNFFNQEDSETFQNYTQRKWYNNVIASGFRFAGWLATDGICLNSLLEDRQYCYSTTFLNCKRVNNNFWLNVA